MPSVKTKFSAGIADPAGSPGPEFLEDSLNWFWHDGTLKKRMGMEPRTALTLKRTQTGVRMGARTSGTIAASAGPHAFVAGDSTILIGGDNTFNRVDLYVEDMPCDPNAFTDLEWGTVQFSLGSSSWGTIRSDAYRARGVVCSGGAGSAFPVWPAVGVAASATTTSGTFSLSFQPPSTWAKDTIGGQNKYWIEITCGGVGDVLDIGVAPASLDLVYVYEEENRVLSLTKCLDRNGAAHEFAVALYGDDGDQLKFFHNGTELTASDGLVPVTGAPVFSVDTVVRAEYHGATDRIIGHISGLGWFYYILDDANVYTLTADGSGDGYPATGVDGGFMAGMPEAKGFAVHDSRLFAWTGQELRWSGSGPYLDIWANRNIIFVDDGLGPITGAAVFQGSLILFKRRAIYAVQANGRNDGDGYDAVPLSNNIGAVGGICRAGDALFFVGEDGFYVFDGQKAQKINNMVDPRFISGELGVNWAKSVGVYYSPLNQLRFFFPRHSSNIMDAAVYISASSLVTAGERMEGIGVYPQGRGTFENTEYGFQATAICADYTGTKPVILLGDRYGMIHEMDVGDCDNGTSIAAELTQVIQNYAGNELLMAGPVFFFQDGTAFNGAVTVKLILDGDETKLKTVNAYSYAHGMSREVADFAWNGTMRHGNPGASKRLNFATRCHGYALRVMHSSNGTPELNGSSIEITPLGNRGHG